LGGIDFLIKCIIDNKLDDMPTSVHWQWLLGRLYMLDRLLEEHSSEFEATARVVSSSSVTTEPRSNHDRSFSVLQFGALHMSFAHAKVAKMVHRVFYNIAALQAQVGGMAVVERICALLHDIDPHVRQHMRYRLQKVAIDYSTAAQTLNGSSKYGESNPVVFFVSAQTTPSLEMLADSSNDVKHTVSVSDVTGSDEVCYMSSDCASEDTASNQVTNTVIFRPVPSIKRDPPDIVSIGGHVQMVDACVATSPSLVHRRKGASRFETDGSSSDDCGGADEADEADRPNGLTRMPLSGEVNRFPLSSDLRLTGDSCDLTLTPSASEDRVSFKKEVATTPHSSPPRSAGEFFLCRVFFDEARVTNRVDCVCSIESIES
jgi:hypothetical protein